jgi:hypothetical protein
MKTIFKIIGIAISIYTIQYDATCASLPRAPVADAALRTAIIDGHFQNLLIRSPT